MENIIATTTVTDGDVVTIEAPKKVEGDTTSGYVSTVKTHPRMYAVARIDFDCQFDNIEIPYAIRSSILRAIESAGYSVTMLDSNTATINVIKKQLQKDA